MMAIAVYQEGSYLYTYGDCKTIKGSKRICEQLSKQFPDYEFHVWAKRLWFLDEGVSIIGYEIVGYLKKALPKAKTLEWLNK